MSDLSSFERAARFKEQAREYERRLREAKSKERKSYCIHTDWTELWKEIKHYQENPYDNSTYNGHP